MSQYGVESFKVLTTLLAYRIVALDTTGTYQVKLPAAATDRVIGVTKNSVRDTTSCIPVAICGITKVQFNDTISAGALVACDSGGLGLAVPHVDTTAGSFVIGRALQTVTLTGTLADIVVSPYFKSIP